MYSPPARSVRTMLLHGLKRAWSSSTAPPKIQKPLSAAIRCPSTDANVAKSHSENSSRQRRSFTLRQLELKCAPIMRELCDFPKTVACVAECHRDYRTAPDHRLDVLQREQDFHEEVEHV